MTEISNIQDVLQRLSYYQNSCPDVVDLAIERMKFIYSLEDRNFTQEMAQENYVAVIHLIERIEMILGGI